MLGQSRRGGRRLATLAALLVLALLPLSGCDIMTQVTIQIVDFESSEVQGLAVWRQDPVSGDWERRYEVDLGEAYVQDGIEYVDYSLLNEDGSVAMRVPTEVGRHPTNPDQIELSMFVFLYDEPAPLKVTTYNAAGDSPLSQATISM